MFWLHWARRIDSHRPVWQSCGICTVGFPNSVAENGDAELTAFLERDHTMSEEEGKQEFESELSSSR